MIYPTYLQTKLGDTKIEAVPSMFKFRLRLMSSDISPYDKNYVICRYGVRHGKIDDLSYRRFCREARYDSASGQHAYICAE